MHRIILFMGIFCLLSCNEYKAPTQQPKVSLEQEDDVLMRLSSELIPQPRSRDQEEQNQILNYAIENLLNVERSISGMYFQIIEPGKGSSPSSTSTVEAHYVGRTLEGVIFDSSYARGKSQRFTLNSVIPGWRQAIKMLKPGGRGVFLLPSRLAYGEKGLGELIAPNTVLQFEIELIRVE